MCPEFLFKLLSVLNPPSQRRKSWENRSRISELLKGNNARKYFYISESRFCLKSYYKFILWLFIILFLKIYWSIFLAVPWYGVSSKQNWAWSQSSPSVDWGYIGRRYFWILICHKILILHPHAVGIQNFKWYNLSYSKLATFRF